MNTVVGVSSDLAVLRPYGQIPMRHFSHRQFFHHDHLNAWVAGACLRRNRQPGAFLPCTCVLGTFLPRTCVLGSFLLVALSACSTRPIVRPDVFPDECILLPSPVVSKTSATPSVVTIGTESQVQGFSPETDPLISAQMFETLFRHDCTGEIHPGLAASWKSSDSGKRWAFTLQDDAYFSDGSPVTATDVAASWRQIEHSDAPFDSLHVDGLMKLTLFFSVPQTSVPTELISMDYAVRKETNGAVVPRGTGPFRFTNEQAIGTPLEFSLADTSGLTLRFIGPSSRDERDLLDKSIDLLVTRDPATINYARARSDRVLINLPWDRMYVVVSTSRARTFVSGAPPEALPSMLPEDLFRDAVRGDARTSTVPSWWSDAGSCQFREGYIDRGPELGLPGQTGLPRKILYDASDAVARELAERLVALAAMHTTGSPAGDSLVAAIPGLRSQHVRPVSAGVPETEFEKRLTYGQDFGYILSVARRPYGSCSEIRRLIRRAPWIRSGHFEALDTVIPLVDTHPRVIARKNRLGLTVDWFGNLSISVNSRNGN